MLTGLLRMVQGLATNLWSAQATERSRPEARTQP